MMKIRLSSNFNLTDVSKSQLVSKGDGLCPIRWQAFINYEPGLKFNDKILIC